MPTGLGSGDLLTRNAAVSQVNLCLLFGVGLVIYLAVRASAVAVLPSMKHWPHPRSVACRQSLCAPTWPPSISTVHVFGHIGAVATEPGPLAALSPGP